jgi:hypothetical protein
VGNSRFGTCKQHKENSPWGGAHAQIPTMCDNQVSSSEMGDENFGPTDLTIAG